MKVHRTGRYSFWSREVVKVSLKVPLKLAIGEQRGSRNFKLQKGLHYSQIKDPRLTLHSIWTLWTIKLEISLEGIACEVNIIIGCVKSLEIWVLGDIHCCVEFSDPS